MRDIRDYGLIYRRDYGLNLSLDLGLRSWRGPGDLQLGYKRAIFARCVPIGTAAGERRWSQSHHFTVLSLGKGRGKLFHGAVFSQHRSIDQDATHFMVGVSYPWSKNVEGLHKHPNPGEATSREATCIQRIEERLTNSLTRVLGDDCDVVVIICREVCHRERGPSAHN